MNSRQRGIALPRGDEELAVKVPFLYWFTTAFASKVPLFQDEYMSVTTSVANILKFFFVSFCQIPENYRDQSLSASFLFNGMENNPQLTTLFQMGKTGILYRLQPETDPRLGPFGISLLGSGLIAGETKGIMCQPEAKLRL